MFSSLIGHHEDIVLRTIISSKMMVFQIPPAVWVYIRNIFQATSSNYSTIIYQNQNVLLKYKNAYGLNGMIREHDNIENAMLSFLTIT